MDANLACAARSLQLISQITYSCVRRGSSALVKATYIDAYNLLLYLADIK
jgi:hypothetical protein